MKYAGPKGAYIPVCTGQVIGFTREEVAALFSGADAPPLKTYTCAACGGVFDDDTPEEEKLAEMRSLCGDVPPADRRSVCDGCFQKIKAKLEG